MDRRIYFDNVELYDGMMISKFDYDSEYSFYEKKLADQNLKKGVIAEVGCGTGNLAFRFLSSSSFRYFGVDFSENMVKHSRMKCKTFDGAIFRVGNMKELDKVFDECFLDAILFTGRGFAHLLSNTDVMSCLSSCFKVLKNDGVVMIDNFFASPENFEILKRKSTSQSAYGKKKFSTVRTCEVNFSTGWTWDWKAVHTIQDGENEKRELEDCTTMRCFTRDEMELFLNLCRFRILENDKFRIRTGSLESLFSMGRKMM